MEKEEGKEEEEEEEWEKDAIWVLRYSNSGFGHQLMDVTVSENSC